LQYELVATPVTFTDKFTKVINPMRKNSMSWYSQFAKHAARQELGQGLPDTGTPDP
jgi:hypothetical protein